MRELVKEVVGEQPLRLRTRCTGPWLHVDVEVAVPSKWSASAAHQLVEHVRRRLMTEDQRITEVNVHVNPKGSQVRRGGMMRAGWDAWGRAGVGAGVGVGGAVPQSAVV